MVSVALTSTVPSRVELHPQLADESVRRSMHRLRRPVTYAPQATDGTLTGLICAYSNGQDGGGINCAWNPQGVRYNQQFFDSPNCPTMPALDSNFTISALPYSASRSCGRIVY